MLFGASLIPPIFFMIQSQFYGGEDGVTVNFLINLAYSVGPTVTITTGCSLFISFLQKRIDWRRNTVYRLLVEVFGVGSIAVIVAILFTYGNPILENRSPEYLKQIFGTNVLFNVGITFFIVSLVEGGYFFSQWKKTVLERERLQKEHFKSQFQNLKNQVNPHFLFNSLNALTGLIETSQDQAIEYVQNLSKYLRQVLAQTEDEVISIEEELNLLKNYYQLQKGRFMDKLQLSVDLDSKEQVMVVPLALQMLVENAIKHNVIGGREPLEVKVWSDADFIVVRNNKKPRTNTEESTGVGLENIKRRYQYLTSVPVDVQDHPEYFEVRLPKLTLSTK